MKFSINTSVPITFEKVEDISDSRFTKVRIYLMHTGKNLNNSYFSKEVVEQAIPSLANIPILGFIQVDNQNQADFNGHEQRLVIDEDGVKIEYLGRAYGVIPQDNNARFEMRTGDDGVEREFLVVDAILWNKFQEAIDIFERDGAKPQSMELDPNSIKGEFKKGVFHFSEFKFEGACILGSTVTPAMVSSIIEKVDFSTASNVSFAEMLTEFNQFYSSLNQSSMTDLNSNNQKGGKGVDQLLELFAQYPALTEEDVAEVKANLEQYTEDTLKAKLDELLAEKEKSQQPEDQFTTAKQLGEELRLALSKEKIIDRWGSEVRAYWYIDHDDNRVYAESVEIGYLPVGLNYTKKGDFVEIDFSSKKRVKFVPQDMEGDDAPSSFVSMERNEFEIEKAKEETKKEVSGQFAEVQKELDEIKPQFEELQTKNQELQSQIESFSADQLTEENKQLKEQINELTAYKQAREKQDKLDVVKKFTQLSDEDKQPFIDEIDKYTVDELEEKLFALIGKKGISSFSTQKPSHLIVGLAGIQASNKSDQPEWVALVEQYKLSKQQ